MLTRDPATGALTQATDGSGCIVDAPLAGCATGVQLSGANAVAVSPRRRAASTPPRCSATASPPSPATTAAGLAQKAGHRRLPRLPARRRLLVRPRDGRARRGSPSHPTARSVYVAAFKTGAIDVLDRDRETGAVAQKPGAAGCLAPRSVPGCTRARALRGVSSVAVSPDGRNVYSTSFASNAVDVFRRKR